MWTISVLAQYNLTTFTVPAVDFTEAQAINNNGDVAGTTTASSVAAGFIRSSSGSFTKFALPIPCIDFSRPPCVEVDIRGINDLGQLIGTEATAAGSWGFFRDQTGVVTTFLPPSGATFLGLYGLTNAGESIAQVTQPCSSSPCPPPRYYIRDSAGALTPLPNPAGFTGTTFVGINNTRQVAGYATATFDGMTSGFLYDLSSGAFSFFRASDSSGSPISSVNALNDSGTVTGSYLDGVRFIRYFDGTARSILPSSLPMNAFGPTGINQALEIVGFYSTTAPSGASSVDGYVATPVLALGGVLTSRVLVETNSDGRLEVFVRGSDSGLWHRWQTSPGSGWSAWQSLGGVLIGDPAVATNADGRLEAFVRGADGALWHTAQTSPGSSIWTGWTSLGGYLTSNLAVGTNANGALEVLARGGDNALWDITQTSPGVSWGDWRYLGGIIASDASVVALPDGRLAALVLGADNGAWWISQITPGSSWGAWSALGGSLMGKPAAVVDRNGRVEVFARATDSTLWHTTQTSPGDTWTGFAGLGGTLISDPAAGFNVDGSLEVFALGSDFALWHWLPTAPIYPWTSLGGRFDSTPTIARNADGSLVAFDKGRDQSLYYIPQVTPGKWF
jgi:hypothetical protein